MNAWHMISPQHDGEGADDADRRGRLERLDQQVRTLERERLAARSTRGRLVALDVELCRVEAARRMLATGTPTEPDP